MVVAALAAAILASAGCTTPAVRARAVWVGSEPDEDGSRTLFAYSGGTITASRVRPTAFDPEADTLPLLVELDPRGRGALVRAVDDGWLHDLGDGTGLGAGYIDLAHGRALPLWLPAAEDATSFLASGAGLWWFEGCGATLAVLPFAPGLAPGREQHGGASTVAPLRRGVGSSGIGKPTPRIGCDGSPGYAVASAADAPVLYVLGRRSSSLEVRADEAAVVEALRIPGLADEPARIEVLAQGRLPVGYAPLRLPGVRCVGGGPSCGVAVVDPDGEAVSMAVYSPDCRLLRWEAATGKARCAVPADAPQEILSERLVAAISAEHYVYREGLTTHRYAWRTQTLVSRPVLGEASEVFVRVAMDGRAVTVGTTRGPALRVTTDAMDVLNIEQRDCPNPQPPVASADGRWLAWTCTLAGEDGEDGLAAGEVVRVSSGGVERFQGVPMWALAIDDDGNVLLHSRKNQDFSFDLLLPPDPPRNLYVLAGDGELARVDGLEPDPELILGLAPGQLRWIHAQGL